MAFDGLMVSVSGVRGKVGEALTPEIITRFTAAFGAYVPDPKLGPIFMTLIERTFGKDITTRTWDSVAKVVKAG